MIISEEISRFNFDMLFLGQQVSLLNSADSFNASNEQLFFVEAIAFKLFRASERMIRAIFLESCVNEITPFGTVVVSKLRCPNHEVAESILKGRNAFLDWGNTKSVSELSTLIFENGFPVSDIFLTLNSALVDLQRIRNYIAHDSKEAVTGFEKAVPNYVHPQVIPFATAGALLLSRRAVADMQVVKIIHQKISQLSVLYSSL